MVQRGRVVNSMYGRGAVLLMLNMLGSGGHEAYERDSDLRPSICFFWRDVFIS